MTLTASTSTKLTNSMTPVLRTYTGTDPAGTGTEWSEAVPAGKIWRVLNINVALVTDANVANRRPDLVVADSAGAQIYRQKSPVSQAASATYRYNFAAASGLTHHSGLGNILVMNIPDILLGPGFTISSSTQNVQATDNWGSPILTVEEYSF